MNFNADFGDGTIYGENSTFYHHIYEREGIYNITATAYNNISQVHHMKLYLSLVIKYDDYF